MCAAMRPDAMAAAARDVHVRAVEQGARVLAAPWGEPQVVLQMQRGNLEGVAPRLLVLMGVLEALDKGEYGEAWRQASSHRLDLNIMVDYCWPRFLDQVGAFVKVSSWDTSPSTFAMVHQKPQQRSRHAFAAVAPSLSYDWH